MSRGDPGRTARTRGNRSTTTLQPGSRGRAERTGAGAARSRLRDGAGQREPDPACAMRAQRDAAHPASRRASPARRNPPALDSHEPASHNATPDDITNTTPHHPGHAASALLALLAGSPITHGGVHTLVVVLDAAGGAHRLASGVTPSSGRPAPPRAPHVGITTASEGSSGRPASTTLFSLYYASSPSTVREKGAQQRIKGRSGRKGT